MAASPTPDPSQSTQGAPPPQGGDQGAPSGAPASPGLMALAKIHQLLTNIAQSPDGSAGAAGIAKATQGISEAMSAIASSSPNQQGSPSQSPSY